MLAFSILWVVLAATVTVIANMRRTPSPVRELPGVSAPDSGRGLAVLAVVSSVALLAGFVYVTMFLVSRF
jgi:hypothetical protein